MSRFGRYVREKVVKVLVTALVVGSVAGNEGDYCAGSRREVE